MSDQPTNQGLPMNGKRDFRALRNILPRGVMLHLTDIGFPSVVQQRGATLPWPLKSNQDAIMANTQISFSLPSVVKQRDAVLAWPLRSDQDAMANTQLRFFEPIFSTTVTAQTVSHGEDMADPTREEIDTKVELAAAQTAIKFAQLIGKIDTSTAELKGEIGKLETHLSSVESATSGVKATVILSALTAIAIVIGVLAFGQQWFGVGMTARDIIRATITEERIQHLPAPQQ